MPTPPPAPALAAEPEPPLPPRSSLRTQMALAFGALVIALGLLLSLLMGEMMKQRIQKDVSASLHSVAHNASKLLATGLQDRAREVWVMAQSQGIWEHGLESPQVLQAMARRQAMQPYSLWIGAADLNGVVRAATGDMLRGQSVLVRPWFSAGLQGLHVGDVHPAKMLASLLPPNAEGEPQRFVDFSAPILSKGKTVGVLALHGSWDWTREVMEGLLPPTAQQYELELFIFDRAGKVIYAPNGQTTAYQARDQRLPTTAATAATAATMAADAIVGAVPAENASIATWADGQRYLTAIVALQAQGPAADLGWRIVAREPVALAFADARKAMQWAIALGLGAAFLAALLAWLAARRISMDLYGLAQAVSAVEDGSGSGTSASIPLRHSSREVQTLSRALEHMARRVLSHNHEMEAQVRARTQQLEAANAELHRQARSDPLTGVLNRRGLDAQFDFALALAQRSGRPLSLISIDVDHFKLVNDTYGHAQGDEVLKSLAHTLQESLRSTDLVARLGGEEFVALLPDTDLAGALNVAEELRLTIADQQHAVVGHIFVSLGVSMLRPGEKTATALLERADAALYAAKHQGRNRVCVQA